MASVRATEVEDLGEACKRSGGANSIAVAVNVGVREKNQGEPGLGAKQHKEWNREKQIWGRRIQNEVF